MGMANRLIVSRLSGRFISTTSSDSYCRQRSPACTWHRREELPRYVALIDAFLPKLENGLEKPSWTGWCAEIAPSRRLAGRAAPEFAVVLESLEPPADQSVGGRDEKSERERFEKLEASEEDYVRHRLKAGRRTCRRGSAPTPRRSLRSTSASSARTARGAAPQKAHAAEPAGAPQMRCATAACPP